MLAKHKSALLLTSIQLTLLSGALLPGISFAEEPTDVALPDQIFSDVEIGDSFYLPIQVLKEDGLIQGYDDGSFKPYQEINRAEALKVLMKALPLEDMTINEPLTEIAATEDVTASEAEDEFNFDDVQEDEWFYQYVADAFASGIVEGYPDGLFHPERTINRAEALKIVLLQENPNLIVTVEEPPYSDVPIDAWFAPYAKVSKERTLFLESRDNGSLSPDNNMSRAEFVILIYRLIKSSENTLFARTTWYGSEGVNWGTASGEPFDVNKMATAHKTLPFGTIIRVTNQANGKSVDVEVNDRGPYATGVDIDLTQSAFAEIASVGAGIIMTEFEILETPEEHEVIESIGDYGF